MSKYLMGITTVLPGDKIAVSLIPFESGEFAQMITIFNGCCPDDKSFKRISCAVETDAGAYITFLDSDKMRAAAVHQMLDPRFPGRG